MPGAAQPESLILPRREGLGAAEPEAVQVETLGSRRRAGPERPVLVSIALVILALAAGWFARGLTTQDHTASVRVVEGWAYHGVDGGIGCCAESEEDAGGLGYFVVGASWRDLSEPQAGWHDPSEFPDCLGTTRAVRVRMGVVDVRPTSEAPGGPRVTWLECL